MKPKHFITFVPSTADETSYIVATSRQYTKELAQKELHLYLERSNIPVPAVMHTKELVIDDNGVIRILDEKGDAVPLDTVKL
jgi:phosphatidylserine/phosphatidylglycerophosphate/cardiolipin synthase-like enzyme